MTSGGPRGDVLCTADPVGSTAVSGGAPGLGRTEQLLCIDGDRSFTVTMPSSGELVIGRGPDAGLAVDDPLVSRAHALLLAVPDGLRLSDLGSRHGTLLNGERLTEPRLVGSGDVVGIGNAVLVVRRPARTAGARATEQPALIQRLTEELSRVVEYERELSLVIARGASRDPGPLLAAVADRLRVIDAAAPLGGGFVAALLPERSSDEALGLARALAALDGGRVAVGVATAPHDGIDPDAVLGAARAACAAVDPGGVRRASEAIEVITAGPQRILVADPAMARLYELARRLARSAIPILIHGETGAGKELAAAAIHAFSARAAGPFVSVNCAAIPESLAESELFGHARGAFSGAATARAGHLETASGGTLFLDEIGELSPAIQAKLLRALESGELIRVGETAPRIADLRIVAATHRDLRRDVDDGRFRRDLFFRLGAARLELPPLRDRPRDLALLARTLLDDACRQLGRTPLALSAAAAVALLRHDWPGNVRELRHAIDYGAAAAPDGARELEIWHLPTTLAAAARRTRDAGLAAAPVAPDPGAPPDPADAPPGAAGDPRPELAPVPGGGFRPIADEVRELERARMVAALRATAGVQNRAAALIEMPLRTFVTKVKRYAISPSDWGGT
ncbi:MAG TPA: sigma 54-interacting transcriptional regulator [Kofleriaceae bacterium]|jgi:DNA-binding NtrC family response regulator|nr:sigma 54-interacting transcriptional regulator [Kofleriaceae bacterium]